MRDKGRIASLRSRMRKGEDQQLKAFADKQMATLQDHAKSSFELAGEKQEYQKLCKIQGLRQAGDG